jgi:hypothetical protein
VEEGWRAADDICGSKEHTGANLVPVVEDGAVGETCSFGHRGRAGGELDVYNVVVEERSGGGGGWGMAVCMQVCEGSGDTKGIDVYTAGRVVDDDDVFE